MASSRLEKIGTIFTRITGLIRARAMKMEDRPIWYDLYKAFPPELPPKYDRPAPNTNIRNIFYQEDLIRAKYHKKVGKAIPMVNLNDQKVATPSQKLIHLCEKIQLEKKIGVEEAFEEAFDVLKAEGLIHKKPESSQDIGLATAFKQAMEKQSSVPLDVNVKDIFKTS